MAFSPISLIPIQYQNPADNTPASGFVIKLFAAGGSTNILMATDSTGDTTFTDVQLNSDGYPEFNGSEVIPYIDQSYKFRMYETQADADADLNAVRTFDNLSPASITGEFSIEDAVNGAVTDVLTLTHTTSGAPGVGIGTGIKFVTETAADNNETGMQLHSVATDVGAASEDFKFLVRLMKAGTIADAWEVGSTGDIIARGTTEATSATASANTHAGGISSEKAIWAAGDIRSDKTFIAGATVSAGDQAAMGFDSTHGLKLTGQGSVNDWNLFNDALSSVLRNPTGTANMVAAGSLTITGAVASSAAVSGTTFDASGAVSVGDNASIGNSSADGLQLTGQGSTNDINILNDAGSSVIRVPTGTVAPVFAGIANFAAAGIVFDNEVFDTYDVSTWTPNLSDGSNTDATLTTATGRAVQIGGIMFISCHIVTSSIGSLSGTIRVTGLPATSSSSTGQWAIVGGQALGLAITATANAIGMIGPSTTEMLLHLWDSGSGTSGMTAAEWSSNGQLTFSGFYEV